MQSFNEHKLVVNKSVFPIVSKERKGNYNWDLDKYKLLDKRIEPLTLDECSILKSSGYSMPSVINEGSLLMRHPYLPHTIIDANYDKMRYLQEKFGHYAVILNYLGATRQELKAKITKQQTRHMSAKGKIKCRTKFSIKGAFSRFTKEKYEVLFTKEINGTKERDYQKARDYAVAHGLTNDPFIEEIIGLQDKPITNYISNIVISKDYNDILDAAATLSVMGNAFNLDGNFKMTVQTREEYSICQDIKFEDTFHPNMPVE